MPTARLALALVLGLLFGAETARAEEPAPLAKRTSAVQRRLSKFWIDQPAFEMRASEQVKELLAHGKGGAAVAHFFAGHKPGTVPTRVVIGDGTESNAGAMKAFHLAVAKDLLRKDGTRTLMYKGASKTAYEADAARYGRGYADQASLFVSRYATHALVRANPKIEVLDLGTRAQPNLPHVDSPHVDDWTISDRESYTRLLGKRPTAIRGAFARKLELPEGGYPLGPRARR